MPRSLLLFLLLACSVNFFAITQETASLTAFVLGNAPECAYDNWMSHISEGIASEGYNVYAPYERQTTGFGDFFLPDELTLENWSNVISLFNQGLYEDVQNYLDFFQFPYEVIEFHDTDTDRTYFLLREVLNLEYFDDNGTDDTGDDEIGSFDYGWGLFIFNSDSVSPIIVNMVHPNDDYTAVPVSVKAFQELDASYLLIAGAGREVMWTEIGTYSNSKSLSDPSRNADHGFNTCYQAFCNSMRETYGRREFSPQIHSYDWSGHANHASCQISAGYNRDCPNLPIRDLSDLKIDIINYSQHLMIPENTIGSNEAVYLNDYYAVNYNTYGFTFTDGDTTYVVNDNIDLPGYSQNRQMLHTYSGWNHYDVFEPFFHLEMDELPNCYSQTEDNWFWFYGYDIDLQTFDREHLFDYTLQYYTPWIEALGEVIPLVLEIDDGLVPNNPDNFLVANQQYDSVSLYWDPVSSFDFYSFEIIYDTEPVSHFDHMMHDRSDSSILASQLATETIIDDLLGNQPYYFRIRALDYNGNYSEFSPEINTITSPVDVSGLNAVGRDALVLVEWLAEEQNGNLGFNLYRKVEEGNFELHDSYLNNPVLQGTQEPDITYVYEDHDVENFLMYRYRISAVNEQGMEFWVNDEAVCSPWPIYYLIVSNGSETVSDSAAFSANPFATDGYDIDYDIFKTDVPVPDYVYAAFYEENWRDRAQKFSLQTHTTYDPDLSYKTWDLAIVTDQLDQSLSISVSDNYGRDIEKLYLRNDQNNSLINLMEEDLVFTTSSQDTLFFTLFWGNLKPSLYIVGNDNYICQAGDEVYLHWYPTYNTLIDHLDVSIQNDTDSVFVAAGLINTVTEIYWTVPENITLPDAEVFVDIFTVHDEFIRRTSNFKLGLLPSLIELEKQSGWQMLSSCWPDQVWNASAIFNQDVELYTYNENGEYDYTDIFQLGEAYWSYSPIDYSYETEVPVQKTEISFDMAPGWNYLPNPHPALYQVRGLRFDVDGSETNFREMINDQLLSRAIYVYRNGSYEMTDIIEPFESFFIHSYTTPETELKCVFKPYNDSYPITENIDWKLPLLATQEGSDSDGAVLGVSILATESYNFQYDLAEVVHKPFTEGIMLYFPKTDSVFRHQRLNTEFKQPLSTSVAEEKFWDFELEISSLAAIEFSGDFSDYPEGYHLWISIDGLYEQLLPEGTVSFYPQNTETIPGQFIVQNELVTGTDEILPPISGFINYPNPFNPETTICFGLNKPAQVELVVYNIKGQKVRTLQKGLLTSGNHEFVWDGKDSKGKRTASGIYFARLKAGDQTQIRKMLIIK